MITVVDNKGKEHSLNIDDIIQVRQLSLKDNETPEENSQRCLMVIRIPDFSHIHVNRSVSEITDDIHYARAYRLGKNLREKEWA